MVIIKQKSEENQIYVPKHYATTSSLTLEVKSRLTNDVFHYVVEDLSALTDYFLVEIDTESLPDGEYEYRMLDNGKNDKIVSSGLLRIGEYKPENEEYKYEQEYYQYEG